MITLQVYFRSQSGGHKMTLNNAVPQYTSWCTKYLDTASSSTSTVVPQLHRVWIQAYLLPMHRGHSSAPLVWVADCCTSGPSALCAPLVAHRLHLVPKLQFSGNLLSYDLYTNILPYHPPPPNCFLENLFSYAICASFKPNADRFLTNGITATSNK